MKCLKEIARSIDKKITCDTCGSKFSSVASLVAHTKLHHGPNRLCYQCNLCNSSCTTPYNLIIHIQTLHKETINLEQAKALYTKKKNTQKGKPKAKKINKTAKYRKELTCTICGIVCHGTGNMNRHMLRHSDIKKRMPIIL